MIHIIDCDFLISPAFPKRPGFFSRHISVCIALSLVIGMSGCGKSERPTFPVTGKVTFNGNPLPTGTVVFVPIAGGPTATGQVKEDGTYSLTTFKVDDGAVPGNHTVMVSAMKDNGPNAAFTLLIPEQYSSDKSGLTAEVKDIEKNVIDFNLTGAAQVPVRPAVPMP